ncbi:hypothetical protein H6S82_13720 [Planktothrix sp. FACHB-1355]|uniref:Uncharacterized protein n=1 Tax=Aerosakkonema funiforme FACHB-1375 TaxID=2949571 RepID=A0A926VJA8_9CYAN|nr:MULTISPECIES: hypothetical protein [Oscillatoriales]MBD2184894.1 hypothetical protein [Aerosakkonema funiforme FACHB-1375]MBD3559913.1 hypothetical protein [Planktothrix sp. FACHB-1355]
MASCDRFGANPCGTSKLSGCSAVASGVGRDGFGDRSGQLADRHTPVSLEDAAEGGVEEWGSGRVGE